MNPVACPGGRKRRKLPLGGDCRGSFGCSLEYAGLPALLVCGGLPQATRAGSTCKATEPLKLMHERQRKAGKLAYNGIAGTQLRKSALVHVGNTVNL
jgi:hypothetical protein